VQQHLDYIKDMGFTAIWMMPVLENDMQRSSYHGYSTTDYYKVDPRFGTNESFRELVQTSMKMGIKHILDVIPNHCGSEHRWMNDLPAKDWINKWDTYTQTNHRKSIANDPYASEYDSRHFTDGWFVRSMPDLNQRNLLLANYLTQNAIWWIEYLGLAGLRIDTYPYSDPEFLRKYCKSILAEYPNLNIVGEQWHPDPAFVAYWQKGVVNANGYQSELPCMMDFPLQRALIRDLNSTTTWDQWVNVYETLSLDALYADPYNIMIFPDNHDMSRIFTQVNEDYNLYRMALVLLATTRGIPQFFYGTEILMKNPGTDEHTVIRSDFPGGWSDDKVNGFTSSGLTDQEKEAQQFVHTLLNWRKNNAVIHSGKLMHFAPVKGVYVYFRYNDAKKVMVILNANKEAHELSLEPYREMLKGISSGRDIFSDKECALGDTLMLPEAGPVILELKN
jgi:glycosidase